MTNDASMFLTGNFAPLRDEHDIAELAVTGEVPAELRGTLYRNGPNPQFPPDPSKHHLFLGDGMIHAFTIEDGRVGYRNRWVRTSKWKNENKAGRSLGAGFASSGEEGLANTNVIWHGGKLLALEEAHAPVELDPRTLETRGPHRFGGVLPGPFTAHPKADPVTGELVFFGYSAAGPLSARMSYGTLDREGKVTRAEMFNAPYCSMVHDFAVTERHVLFPILPLAGSMTRAMIGGAPFVWEPGLGGHLGVIRRDRGVASLRWFRAESCFVFHVLNAWDAGEKLVADVMEYESPPLFPRADGVVTPLAPAKLVRWTLDLAAQTDFFSRARIDDLGGEFPRADDRFAGHKNRFGMFAAHVRGPVATDTIAWFDLSAGARTLFTLPEGDTAGEPVFVPRRPDAAEGDGFLLSVVWRGREDRSDLIVLDTHAIDRGPVATVHVPHRVPFGFHGNFVGAA